MNCNKIVLTSSFFLVISFNFVRPMMISVPAPVAVQPTQDALMHMSMHHIHRPELHTLRLRETQFQLIRAAAPTPPEPVTLPVSATSQPSPGLANALSYLNKEAVEHFNKAAPYLALCAFVAQYAVMFNQRQQPPISAQALANLCPAEQRLHAILQENEQIKKRLKAMGWQALFSFALLNPRFNESYEELQTQDDMRQALNVLNPTLRAAALNHLVNRCIAKAKTFATAHISKLLLLAYRCISPNTAHPSLSKTAVDVIAMASIYTFIGPQIVNSCTSHNGPVAIMARENALRAYNYLPENIQSKLLLLKKLVESNFC
ncbi:MAG: hypothetical protein AMXMBFR12_07250 [Candidatus Babeliales bacterium]